MVISKVERGSINAKKTREFLANTKLGIKGKNLRIIVTDDTNTIDNDTGQVIVSNKSRVDIKQAISEITSSWRKTAEQIIETAKILRRIKIEASNWREIEKEIIGKNIIPQITFKQLMAIASNEVLLNTNYLPKLPMAMASIYEASKIDPANLEELFKENKINPYSTTEKVKVFSTTLPRRNVNWSKLKETEKKASSMIVLLAIEIPVTNHTKVANDIVKQIKNIYKDREWNIQMKAIKPNY
jgi:hypothetical protein